MNLSQHNPQSQLARKQWFLVALLVALNFSLATYSIHNHRQLEYVGGLAEEYFRLGLNLASSGRFYHDPEVDFVFRPPGYIAYIAAILTVTGQTPDENTVYSSLSDIQSRIPNVHQLYQTIYYSQAFLLSITIVLFYCMAVRVLNEQNALFATAIFALNPYLLIFVGALHYTIVHCFLLVALCFLLILSVRSNTYIIQFLVLAGFICGLSSLVRPTTLILPILLLFAYWAALRSPAKAVVATFIFTAAMGCTVIPYSIRNYMATDEIIVVNEQASFILWAATGSRYSSSSNHYNWFLTKSSDTIYKKHTGLSYSYDNLVTHNIALSDAFLEDAFRQFTNDPSIYFNNVYLNCRKFVFGFSTSLLKAFQYIQHSNGLFPLRSFVPGTPQNFYGSYAQLLFSLAIDMLNLLALAGVYLILRNKYVFALFPLVVIATSCIAHTVTHMDIMFYYQKIPFICLFYAVFAFSLHTYLSKKNNSRRNLIMSVTYAVPVLLLLCVDLIVFFPSILSL